MNRFGIALVVGLIAAGVGVALAYGVGAMTGSPVSSEFAIRVAVSCFALTALVLWVLRPKRTGGG